MQNPNSENPNNQAPPEQKIGRGMLYIGWLIALGLLVMFFSQWQNKRENPNSMPSSTSAQGLNEVVLERNYQHHYVANGKINGQEVTFLLDTGATHVSVPKHLAQKLGLKEGAPAFANTANGVVETRNTRIDELRLGSIRLQDVKASINPGMRSDEILLGMSALKDVEFTQRNGTLTLRQYY